MSVIERTNCYVITGGVGFGKTSLVDYLYETKGYCRVPELARILLAEKLDKDDGSSPWISRDSFLSFEEELVRGRIKQFENVPNEAICFADTAIPNSCVFFHKANLPLPEFLLDACTFYRYNPKVFVLPPWPAIYKTEGIRPQHYSEAMRISELVQLVYKGWGYELIDVPVGTLAERASFVLRNLGLDE